MIVTVDLSVNSSSAHGTNEKNGEGAAEGEGGGREGSRTWRIYEAELYR